MGTRQKALNFLNELAFSNKSPQEQLEALEKFKKKIWRKADDETREYLKTQLAVVQAAVEAEEAEEAA